jgi:electron transport complex protein RnfC
MKGFFSDIFGSHLTFPHGVHPEEYKELSCQAPIERMPFADELTIPLSQHLGAPSVPVVAKGERVRRGQQIAKAAGFVSVAQHSPVDGVVVAIGLFDHPGGQMSQGIKIKTDPFSSQQIDLPPVPDPATLDVKSFLAAVQTAGIVGMGGAAFPVHVKFGIPEGKKCRYLMLNGCECEPFLTCDHRLMLEYSEELLDGIGILNRFVGAEKIYIAIEDNKPDAIELLRKAGEQASLPMEVVPMKVKYPQGAEKMMISAILGKEVPGGKLPIDVETLVSNVGSIVALSQYFRQSKPLIERVITVTGTAVRRPSNLLVPIGTSMREVVEFCGGLTQDAVRILLGGPMMGMVQKTLDVPVIKGTSGILILTENEVRDLETFSCIRCGRCLEACPIFLNPARMGLMAKKGLWEEIEQINVMDCFECGSCSFVCPSSIPLVQSFRVAKGIIREKWAREKAASAKK